MKPKRLIQNDDIILDGTGPRYQKEAEAFHKLWEHEELEAELGIDLVTLFKALTNGIWIKGVADSKNKTIFVRPTLYIMGKKLVVGFVIPYTKRTDKEGNYFGTVRYFDGYRKTWALTKEELL